MSAIAAARRGGGAGVAVRRAARRSAVRPSARVVTVAGAVGLIVLAVVLRSRAMGAAFWIDEGIAVGIASHPFAEIPAILRQDGSPPLYYLLLHGWIVAFGDGEAATHALSLVFAVLVVPAALWAGSSLFGARAGWIAAALAATNTYLTYYAQETRMYALVGLLSLLVAATWVHAFVHRDRRYLPPFVVALVLLLYAHNWGLFLAVGTVAAFAVLLRGGIDRALLRDAALAYAAVALLYAPWLPTLVFQALHTGAPWASQPRLQTVVRGLGTLLGGAATGLVLVLIAGSGLADAARRREPAIIALAVLVGVAVLLGWLTSQAAPAFAVRYLAAFIGPLLLLAAVGLARAGRLGLVALAIVLALSLDPRIEALEAKSNVREVAATVQTFVTAGDLVVSTHPEQLPLLAYYLPEGPRYANSLGMVRDPSYFDWTDALARLRAAKPGPTIDRLMTRVGRGQELVLVQPIVRRGRWKAPWTALVRRRAAQWETRLDRDPRLRREAAVPVFGFGPLPIGVRTVVYRRVG